MGVHPSNRNWVADSEVKACASCLKPFTITLRRHHCRGCGKIYCAKCTPHRVAITLYGDLCRVCDQCERRVRALGLLTSEIDADKLSSDQNSDGTDSTSDLGGGLTSSEGGSLGSTTTQMSVVPLTLTPVQRTLGASASATGLISPMTPGPIGKIPSTPTKQSSPQNRSGRRSPVAKPPSKQPPPPPPPRHVAALRTLKFEDDNKMDERVSQLPQVTRDDLLKQLSILRDCLLQAGDAEGAADVSGIEIRVRSKDPSLRLADVKTVQIRVIDKILEVQGGPLLDAIDNSLPKNATLG